MACREKVSEFFWILLSTKKDKRYVAVSWNILSFSHEADQLWLSRLDFISCDILVVISSQLKIIKMLFLPLEQTSC